MLTYVKNFGIGQLVWPFQAWFWLVLSVLGCIWWRKIAYFRATVLCLSASSLIYLVGYFPIVPAFNFRYSYWPAVAMTLAAVLFLVSKYRDRSKRSAGD